MIIKIFSFLTFPAKHLDEQPKIAGTEIRNIGKLYQMLTEVFNRAPYECNIPICFMASEDGTQFNEVRAEVIDLLKEQSVPLGLKLAQRLQATTTNKSGLGLLFLTIGEDSSGEKILLISRFPADEGIVAAQNAETLSVEFVEQVFLKNAHAYKGALYKDSSIESGFWTGNAVDRQINHGAKDLATYWIKDFLRSDLATTSRAGTKRLAVALREANRQTSDIMVKQEISAGATLARNLSGKITTISEFCEKFQLSKETKKAILASVKPEQLADDRFLFDIIEFNKHFSYKSIELDNGAILTASLGKFDQCFRKTAVEERQGAFLFTTEGMIVDERLKKTK